jgi:2-dehydro-3-deoxygalactonokinase
LAETDWIAVDWGTSNVRAWGIGADGAVLFERAAPAGMARMERADYPRALEELVGTQIGEREDLDVLVCGMAGARTGWREAGYLDAPADLHRLAGGAVAPENAGRFVAAILPGVCQRGDGAEDVMRGEETQLLGLSILRPEFSGTVIMPGTHSKWVELANGRLTRFTTAMTGELFDVLSHHSVLRLSVAEAETSAPDEDGIAAGLEAGLADPGRLSGLLFRARAAALLSGKGAGWCAGYLSGLLVGAEVGGHRNWLGSAVVPLLGSARLCRLYAEALRRIGVRSETIDVTEATLAGLAAARRARLQ